MTYQYCSVAVNSPFNNSILSYKYEAGRVLFPGQLVWVPLGKRKEKACILNSSITELEEIDETKVKEIDKDYELDIQLSDDMLNLCDWVTKYYHYPLGQHIFDCLPKPLKRPQKLKSFKGEGRQVPYELNDLQKGHVDKICSKSGFNKWLLHGVTGSGKTAVYLEVIKAALSKGKSVLFLLPEINLTPQFLDTFKNYLDCEIFVYNSSISNSDRFGLWKLLGEDNEPKMILGVRSSVFLPIKDLGCIIVDEEHDSSFKQEDRCPYNARDVAIKRASIANIPVVLGSATPSLETFFQFQKTPEFYLKMENRIGTSTLPEVELIDTRNTPFDSEHWPFAEKSIEVINDALQIGEQVLVFVNRLGFANYLQCNACGYQFHCPNCSTNLKFFKVKKELSCSFCEYKRPTPEQCPECHNMKLLNFGFGTERLSEVLQNLFPDKKVSRFDRDEITTMTKLEARLDEFHTGKIDILIGTQMLSKGHNFKNVNTVLILGIDSQLNFPDFRANERVYHQLTQVSGRSGRFGKDSKVVIQTLNPNNKIFTYIEDKSFDGFYNDEIPIREICHCTPFYRLTMIYVTSKHNNQAISAANEIIEIFQNLRSTHFNKVEAHGPRPALVEKKVNKYTWCILIRSDDINQLHNALNSFSLNFRPHHSVSIKLDVDPYHIH